MRLFNRIIAACLLALAPSLALAQSTLLQAGAATAGHAPMYVGPTGQSQAIVQDSGAAGGGGIGLGFSELLLTARGTGTAPYASQGTGVLGTNFCNYDAPTTNATGYHYLCMSPNAQGGGLIAYGAAGTASTLPLYFNVNGVAYQFPFSISGVVGPSVSVVNDAACWNNTSGTLLKDCGAFVTVGGNNTWTGTNNFTGTFQISSITQTFPASGNIVGTSDVQTLTNKHINAGQVDSGTLPATVMPALTGDVTSSAGAVATTISAGVVTNAKLAVAGAANTIKGAATSTAIADLAAPSCSGAGNALQWVTGTGLQCGTFTNQTAGWGLTLSGSAFSVSTTAPPYGFNVPVNLGITASVGSSALTINVTAQDGTTPSASKPVLVPFRSTTLATGTPVWRSITGALSIVVPSSATLGTANGVPFRIWIFLADNSGTPELGVAVCSNTTTVFPCTSWETNRVTTTTINSSAATSGVLYATSGVSNDSVRIIGYADYSSGLVTAGAWATVPTTLQLMGPGITKPGSVVQTVSTTSTTTATSANTTKVATSTAVTITPTSAINLVKVLAVGTAGQVASTAPNGVTQIFRNSTATPIGAMAFVGGGTAQNISGQNSMVMYAVDSPQSASSTSYTVYLWSPSGAVTTTWLPAAGGTSTAAGVITADEIMGALPEPANDNINPGVFALTG